MRLFTGDNNAAHAVIDALTQKLVAHFPVSLRESEARTVATGVLAWNRANVCPACHGSGYEVIPGTPSLSDKECRACRGTGKTLFQKQFHRDKLKFADWAQVQIEMAQSRAGQEAMRAIAPSFDL
jgi:DnaJ-class molecular chaperone